VLHVLSKSVKNKIVINYMPSLALWLWCCCISY